MMLKLLDLYCKAGGASAGYHRAGFEVTGVDIEPQKRYPFEFVQANALEYLYDNWYRYDVIHASPPCQVHSALSALHKNNQQYQKDHTNVIPKIQRMLKSFGGPYIIENVSGAKRHLDNPLMLCGTMFGLQTDDGNQLFRHRYFETWPEIWFPPQSCQHDRLYSPIGVHGGGQHPSRRKGGEDFGVIQRRIAMGIDWMTGSELNQAIPPAYTEFIGKQLIIEMRGDL